MITFGVPSKREVKQEKYPDIPVLTMEEAPEEKGKTYGFNLNPSAAETLGLELDGNDEVCFIFDTEDENFIGIGVVTGNENVKSRYRVGKNLRFSNKNIHEYIAKMFNTTSELEFKLSEPVDVGVAFILEPINLTEEIVIEDLGNPELELQTIDIPQQQKVIEFQTIS